MSESINMSDEQNNRLAEGVYNTICKALDSKKWVYSKHPEDLVVTFSSVGDDIPMDFVMAVDAKRELIRMLSRLPLTFDSGHRVDGAIATSQINYTLADGSFDYDYDSGKVSFRLTATFKDSLISEGLILYMISCACYTVDEYNDKLLMLAKGLMSLEDFLKGLE